VFTLIIFQRQKKKGKTKNDVDTIIYWLTGYDQESLEKQITKRVDFETFFAEAPAMHPNTTKIKGLICGYRVEEIENKLMQQIRYLDRLIDELARGKKMKSILRE
tara:strand:- start:686 stop:1000 length:315 start_codon:yes stop_codon:yes gene_type:complete